MHPPNTHLPTQTHIESFSYPKMIRMYLSDTYSTSSSSSSCRAACADIPDRLSPFLPIIHRLRQVFRVTSRVLTQLLYVGSCWSSHSCTSMCGGPQEYIAYELVLASPAVSCVLATTPHETPTIRTLAPHHKNYTSSTNIQHKSLIIPVIKILTTDIRECLVFSYQV